MPERYLGQSGLSDTFGRFVDGAFDRHPSNSQSYETPIDLRGSAVVHSIDASIGLVELWVEPQQR
ncbi:hypothetical protein [Rhodococcus sp. NPDC059234]|uniref:hypothetical protein n=1 Tax=Rhodococcus sp. NPDC059234 TaxID=3346781 RepID=UPI00366E34F5